MINLNFSFEFDKLLGSGANGDVWKAKQTWTGETVAIKYLKSFDSDQINRFNREARLLQKLQNNPNIVKFIGFANNTEKPYIVMEYCEGGSIRNFIKKLNTEECLVLLYAVISGLQSIHDEGGFHRDIKPDNILMKQIGNAYIPKISDLGLARDLNPGTLLTQSPFGTVAYMAPEIIKGGNYTQKADIYSLGITMFEMMTGKPDCSYNLSQIPMNFQSLLKRMCNENYLFRPSCQEIKNEVSCLIEQGTNPIGKIVNSITAKHLVGGLALGVIITLLAGKE